MKLSQVTSLMLVFASSVAAAGEQVSNPLGKVLELLTDLSAKVTQQGETAEKAYAEYSQWCSDTSKNAKFAIKTASSQKSKLDAKIVELSSSIEVASSKIEDLTASIAQAEGELKNATLLREKEASDFAAGEKELMDVGDTLGRAIGILEKEMTKNPASLAQVDTTNMESAMQAISAVLDAAAFSTADQKKLAAFVQAKQSTEDDDSDLGAPAAAAYTSHSGGIVEVLEDLKDKAEAELSDMRKAEVNAKHNYEMLKQSLEDQVAADNKDVADEKAGKAAAAETKATAEGDLDIVKKDLAASEEELATVQATCMQTASDEMATVASRAAELKALAEAKKILEETSSGAVSQTYSFLQAGSGVRLRSHLDLARSEVVAMVKRLAKQHHSAALAQLASRIAAAARFGAAAGEEPFAKVKVLITDMIAKLEKQAADEATEKSYCDEQMSKTEAKKAELEDDVSKMTAKIDTAAAKSAQLKEQLKELQAELAALAKGQAEMDKIRMETHADYETAKADLELGLAGVRKALGVLRDYYGAAPAMLQDSASFSSFMEQPAVPTHTKATGAGSSIIGILEVVESDFATNLAKEETEEADAQADYEKITQENKVTKATKEQDVKYKTQESKSLDATTAEISADMENTNSELSAVLEYHAKVKDRCVAKPETYEERKKRREAEISGLKEALAVLRDETAFLQQHGRHRRGNFRGSVLTAA